MQLHRGCTGALEGMERRIYLLSTVLVSQWLYRVAHEPNNHVRVAVSGPNKKTAQHYKSAIIFRSDKRSRLKPGTFEL